MAAKINKKPNVTPKASEIEVKDVKDDAIDEVVTDPEISATENSSDVKKTTDDEVTINEENEIAVPAEKLVKVRPRANHNCNIGGTQYHFEKGVVVTVPQFVKDVLLREDLLQSL